MPRKQPAERLVRVECACCGLDHVRTLPAAPIAAPSREKVAGACPNAHCLACQGTCRGALRVRGLANPGQKPWPKRD